MDSDGAESLDLEAEEVDTADGGDELVEREQTLSDKFDTLEAKLAAAGISYESREDGSPGRWLLVIFFANRRASVRAEASVDALLDFPFQSRQVVPGYDATVDAQADEIEVLLLGRILGSPRDWLFEDGTPITDDEFAPGQSLRLGPCTPAMSALSIVYSRNRPPPVPSLQLRGFGAKTPQEAREVIESVGAGFLFEIDVVYAIHLRMARSRESAPSRVRQHEVSSRRVPSFPRNRYDVEPLALHAYAREAMGMPLLQFLAYYQALEFFFPRYSESEARLRIQNVIKDPRFSPHDPQQMSRLLSAIPRGSARGFGGERDQLRETLRACVEVKEIHDFVELYPERQEFFRKKRASLGISPITLQDRNRDLRDAAADRIYELRCKIVHTKDVVDGEQIDLLLPNSEEAKLLGDDIELVRLVAERVISASSQRA